MSKNLLIVDDQPKNLQIIADYLKESNNSYEIMKAPNGSIALELIDRKIPDLIITDWEMPVMDGIEFIKQLKKNKNLADIPVIMVTGIMTTPANLQTAMDAGAVDYIAKPINKIELMARVSSMLKLSESYKEIKLLNDTKDKFFSIIAHDLKSPFNAILGFGNILIDQYWDYDDEKRLQFIKMTNKAAQHSYELLESLLTWSRSQSGKIQYRPIELNVNELVSKTFSLIKPSADKKNIKLIYSENENLAIYSDQDTTEAILRNLLSNSIKFTPKNGSITVSTKFLEKKKHLEICVSDTGVGMDEAKIKKLFKVEKSISTEGTENEKGTGLGLMLCYEFVKNNGGDIRVESEENIGSKFYFSLPCYEE